jgi:hypothetical protein
MYEIMLLSLVHSGAFYFATCVTKEDTIYRTFFFCKENDKYSNKISMFWGKFFRGFIL